MDIIGLGEAMVEFNQINSGNNYLAGFGGDTSNCIVAAARQGAVAGYISSVGSDTFGDLLLGMWEDEGVDVGTVQRNAHASTGIYFITHSDDGHKFTYYRCHLLKSPEMQSNQLKFYIHQRSVKRSVKAPAMPYLRLSK
jgi:2-dehydro-3-deoxygluconokinase